MNLPQLERRKPFSILVLDDDLMWRHFVKFILELELKISPLLASSGQEALDILAACPIDVVIADLQMPLMDGFQFLKRASVQSPPTKVIIMSAALEPSTPTPLTLLAAGAVASVSKVEIASKLIDLLCGIYEADPCQETACEASQTTGRN